MNLYKMAILRSSYFKVLGTMLILGSCAQVGVPSGGVFDIDPPEIVSISPELGMTGVSREAGGTIVVTFDEYVNVRNLSSQLLVSPPLSKPVEWSMRGKTVTFTWAEELREDATYVFQFGDAVVDVREGNPTNNFLLAFSTGRDLDTLSLKGEVVDVFTSEVEAGVKIFLYEESLSPDSISKGAKPKFVTTTSPQGDFNLKYLPQGEYRLIAVDDDNRDYVWNAGEELGIYRDNISIYGADSLSTPLRLQETTTPPVKYFVSQTRDSLGLIEVELSTELDDSDSLDVGGMESIVEGTNLWVWDKSSELQMQTLSEGLLITWVGVDTLELAEIKESEAASFSVLKGPEGKQISPKRAVFICSRPVTGIDVNLLEIARVDSVNEIIEFDSIWVDSINPFKVNILGDFGRGEVLNLAFLPGSIEGQGGERLADTTSFKWSTFRKNELSELTVIIDRYGWLELISSNGDVVRKVNLEKGESVYFKDLTPGSYGLKWTGDENENGSWDGVDLENWQTPEQAEIMPTKIKVKADWSHEIKWLD